VKKKKHLGQGGCSSAKRAETGSSSTGALVAANSLQPEFWGFYHDANVGMDYPGFALAVKR